MLAKVNEMNKNALILFSVIILAVSSIIIALIVTSASKGSTDALKDFQKAFVSEYGVKPNVSLGVTAASEKDAKRIAEDFSKALELSKVEDAGIKDTNGNSFYITKNKDESVWIHSAYK